MLSHCVIPSDGACSGPRDPGCDFRMGIPNKIPDQMQSLASQFPQPHHRGRRDGIGFEIVPVTALQPNFELRKIRACKTAEPKVVPFLLLEQAHEVGRSKSVTRASRAAGVVGVIGILQVIGVVSAPKPPCISGLNAEWPDEQL